MATGMELRTLGEFTLRNRLLAIEGVSQVTVMGGVLKQYQVLTSPARLAAQEVTLAELTEAARKANVLAGGGVMIREAKESLLRISGQALSLEEIGETPVLWREPIPVRIRDVADVRLGGPLARGDASTWRKIATDDEWISGNVPRTGDSGEPFRGMTRIGTTRFGTGNVGTGPTRPERTENRCRPTRR